MPTAFIHDYSICSPLGCNSSQAFEQILAGRHGLKKVIAGRNTKPEILGSLDAATQVRLSNSFKGQDYSFFEKMCIQTVQNLLEKSPFNVKGSECLFILSTTKGNISALSTGKFNFGSLFRIAQKVALHFGNTNRPVVVSNACISGALALITAKDLIEGGQYKNILVLGCDQLSDFTINGFQSFQALSSSPCRPFDKNRDGLNLGEAAACILLSDAPYPTPRPIIRISGGGLSNDANHLSGPSRTGAELAEAIGQAITEAAIKPADIQMISAHGTATRYNDEMEAKALAIAGVNKASVHSLKSYMGHTLGAAGILETVFAVIAMEKSRTIPSLHFEETDVPVPLNICRESVFSDIRHTLKTASGFGGCNAALVLSKA